MISIRHATLTDLKPMLEWRGKSKASQEAITREFNLLTTKTTTIFLAHHAEQLIGTVQLRRDHNDPDMIQDAVYLQALEVHQDFQRQGIATKLCLALEALAIKEGYFRVTVSIEPHNQASLQFFQSLDYRIFKESEFIWDGKILPVVCFEKYLK
jgi:ribosomal protein S18 acetylase RimI-like enzyme